MPPQFYTALVHLGFENFYVVADQNQQIDFHNNSSRQEIQDCLCIDTGDVIELRCNFRNTRAVARLAQEFYTGDPASPPPALPALPALPAGSAHAAQKPALFAYGANEQQGFDNVIARILKTSDTNPKKLIGIITPTAQVRKRYYDHLHSVDVVLDNGRPRIMTYQNRSDLGQLFFNTGGIMVINAQSCKGLEFDAVFIADIDKFSCWPRIQDQVKNLFYVMGARAMDRIILLKEAGRQCQVEQILPTDSTILERL